VGLSVVLKTWCASAGTARAATGDCDRECLRGFLTQYLDAMIAHDPGKLPLGRVRFTEDTVEMRWGEGLWKTRPRRGRAT
jgi:hypothetical protein